MGGGVYQEASRSKPTNEEAGVRREHQALRHPRDSLRANRREYVACYLLEVRPSAAIPGLSAEPLRPGQSDQDARRFYGSESSSPDQVQGVSPRRSPCGGALFRRRAASPP